MAQARKILAVVLTVLSFPVFFLILPSSLPLTILKAVLFILLAGSMYMFAFPGVDLSAFGFEGKSRLRSGSPDISVSEELRNQYDSLIEMIFTMIKTVNNSYQAGIYIFDPAKNSFTLQSETEKTFLESIDSQNKLIQSVIISNNSLLLQKNDAGEGWDQLFKDRTWRGSETLIADRIVYKDASIGCLLIFSQHFSTIENRDREIFSNLTDLFSRGLDNLEQIESLTLDSYYLERISGLVGSVDIRNIEESLFQTIQNLCRSMFAYDKLTLSLREVNADEAEVKIVDGMQEDITIGAEFNIHTTLHGRPMRENTFIMSNSWDQDYPDTGRFSTDDSVTYNFMTILAVPININGEPRGTLALERMSSKGYTETDLHLLEFLGLSLGGILAWYEEYNRLHQNAIHDGLTGLLNHAAFMDRFEEEMSRATRFDQSLVLVVLDLDKFKRVNDSYGHLFGDHVLKTASSLIKTNVRSIDVVGRYGGEEFAVLLINTTKEGAQDVAHRIVDSISEKSYQKDDTEVNVTISAGMAEFPKDTDQIRDLIGKADMAMYETKARGGNGVTTFGVDQSQNAAVEPDTNESSEE